MDSSKVQRWLFETIEDLGDWEDVYIFLSSDQRAAVADRVGLFAAQVAAEIEKITAEVQALLEG